MSTIGIVGGGASGTLLAARLLRSVTEPLNIVLFEPNPELGLGVAYSTSDENHLLNVPAIGMSAFVEDPDHFQRWAGVYPSSFVPRIEYGAYLHEVFERAFADRDPKVTFTHVQSEVVFIDGATRPEVQTADGRSFTVDQLVLAFGNRPPSIPSFISEDVQHSDRFIANPWDPDAMPRLKNQRVLTIGTGLTFVDLAISVLRRSRSARITGISRHGMLPTAHRSPWRPPFATPEDITEHSRPIDVLHYLRSQGKYWREALDSLRPLNQKLWSNWSDADRQQFLRHGVRYWDTRRHRMANEISDTLKRYARKQRLDVVAADIADVVVTEKYVSVIATDGRHWEGDVLVLCTGPDDDPRHDPLGSKLVASGLATAGPLQRGYAIDDEGRLPGTSIWTIGPVRRGARWESTAMPEIREQAADLEQRLRAAAAVN